MTSPRAARRHDERRRRRTGGRGRRVRRGGRGGVRGRGDRAVRRERRRRPVRRGRHHARRPLHRASSTAAPTTAHRTTTRRRPPGHRRTAPRRRCRSGGPTRSAPARRRSSTPRAARHPTGASPAHRPARCPTQFWYPAQADGGAPVRRGDGPYPLVRVQPRVRRHPRLLPAAARAVGRRRATSWPRRPIPILSGSDGGTSHVDYEKTFADTSFVISQVLALGSDDPLAGMVDPDRIAAAGHSDGEVISFGVGFLECCRDARVKSVIAMAGDLSNANNPHVRDTGTPILHIMELERRVRPVPALHPVGPRQPHRAAVDGEPRTRATCRRTRSRAIPRSSSSARSTVAYLDGTLEGPPRAARRDGERRERAASPARRA